MGTFQRLSRGIGVPLTSKELKSYVVVDGYIQARKRLRACLTSDLENELTEAIADTAERIIVPAVREEAPVITGTLRDSVRASPRLGGLTMKVGTPVKVPYAGPVHFGWKDRNIEPNKFVYRGVNTSVKEFVTDVAEVLAEYEKKCTRKINKR